MAIVTITTDFGNQDFLAGAVKGTLLQENPDFNIVDITHHVSPFNYPQASYITRNTIRNFPKGTFHLVLVNIFDERSNAMLLAQYNNHYIGCPDNGLLPMIAEEKPLIVISLPIATSLQKTTLNYVGIFAKAFNDLENGKAIELLGNKTEPKSKGAFQLFEKQDWIDGQIIFIDNFENVVVNISKEEFELRRRGRNFSIILKGNEVIDKICETYADVPEGEKLALFNSGGNLEIAINKGNAAGLLGLQIFSERQMQYQHQTNRQKNLLYQTVKILFGD